MMYTVVLYHYDDCWFVFEAEMLGINMGAGCAVAYYPQRHYNGSCFNSSQVSKNLDFDFNFGFRAS